MQEAERQKATKRQTRLRARSKFMVTFTCPLKTVESTPKLEKFRAATEDDRKGGKETPPCKKEVARSTPLQENDNLPADSNENHLGGEVPADAEEADEEVARLVKHLCQAIDARPWIRPVQ